MRRPAAVALTVVGLAGILAVGLAVGALASSGSSPTSGGTTSESTTEHGMSMANLYVAGLNGKAEVPAAKGVSPTAAGVFAVWLTHTGSKYTATWKLTFDNLTGSAAAAHIHKGKPGTAGPVLVPLCGPCKSGQTGTATISAAAVTAIKTGATYVNVHTAKNPGGEIRGQVK
jgi:hypothetical protein